MSLELAAGAEVADTYTLTRCIGEGGMGQVWAAKRNESGERVALKFIKDDEIKPNARRRFFREARAATAVKHPSIVRIHEILRLDDDIPVLVMEHLLGESLREKLDRSGKLALRELAELLLPVVSAVGTAHALGIVHRDLKPENIFLADSDGEGDDGVPSVKVLDFGIAKLTAVAGSLAGSTSLTGTGSLLGTPYYMAPEQICGEKDIDHHADIWALGVIIYEALTGVLPTEADNVGQVFKLVVTSTLPSLATAAPKVPDDITSLVDRMLSRRVADRPDDLREVRKALQRYTDAATDEFELPSSVRPDPSGAPVRVGGGVKISIVDEDTDLDSDERPADLALARTATDAGSADTVADSDERAGRRRSGADGSSAAPDKGEGRRRGLIGAAVAAVAAALIGVWWSGGSESATSGAADGDAQAAVSASGSMLAPAVDPLATAGGPTPSVGATPVATNTEPGGDTEPASAASTASAKPSSRSAASAAPPRPAIPPPAKPPAPPKPTASATAPPGAKPPATATASAPAMPKVQDWDD